MSGRGTDAASYEGVDVKGAVVLGDGGMRGIWTQAVKPARRDRRHLGGARRRPTRARTQTPEVFQWGGVPYDDAVEGVRVQRQPQGGGAAEGAPARRVRWP